MANKIHLEILNKGPEIWNQWRKENPEIEPDLYMASPFRMVLGELDLRGINFSGVSLGKARLDGANLERANLSGAYLAETYFDRANLSWADLSQSLLAKASFRNANLNNANLNQAKLLEANLYQANLSGADLSEADLSLVNLMEADLSLANLSGANLYKAKLHKADLLGVDLAGTNLRKAVLSGTDLGAADLSGVDLSKADLQGTDLSGADLSQANLSLANLSEADLSGADLSKASLGLAKLNKANLMGANLSGADLREADLRYTCLVRTNLEGANLTDCWVYGISAWDLTISETIQQDLIITPNNQTDISVDDLRVAQFIYLLLDNKQIRNLIDTITLKTVLILGQFTEERKAIINAMRDELRERNYLPIYFDFKEPGSQYLTKTISTLAHLSLFIIADITDARSIPQELRIIVPFLPSVPIRLLVQRGASEYPIVGHLKQYPWVIEPYQYDDAPQLLASLSEDVIGPAELKLEELREK